MKKIAIITLITVFSLIAFSVENEKVIAVINNVSDVEFVSSEEVTTSTSPAIIPVETTAFTEATTIAQLTEATEKPEDIALSQANTVLAPKIEAICQKYNVVGMSMAVFKGQDILYTKSYGYSDKVNNIAASENTKYRIASISKTITGILAMRLVAQGRLDLDENISNYIGINMNSPNFPDTKITTRQLLTHTSGIVDSSAYETITDGYTYPSLLGLMEYGGMYTSYAPGTEYIYSNLAAGLVCGVIEGITQQRFYTYASDTLFSPLGMDAGFLRTEITDPNNIALIYLNNKLSARTKTWGRVETAYDSIPIGQMYLLGYGDLFITAGDLAKFGIALAGDGTYKDFEVLPKEYVNQMNYLNFQSDLDKVGLSVSITDNLVGGRTLYGHAGQSYGMVSGLYYDPTDGTGVVFITNGCTVQKNQYEIYTITDELVKTVYADYFNVLS